MACSIARTWVLGYADVRGGLSDAPLGVFDSPDAASVGEPSSALPADTATRVSAHMKDRNKHHQREHVAPGILQSRKLTSLKSRQKSAAAYTNGV